MKNGKDSEITVINSKCEYDNNVYISVTMNGGFAAKLFWTGDSEPFEGSYAFYNFLRTYFAEKRQDFNGEIYINPSSTTVCIRSNSQSWKEDLQSLLLNLANLEIDEETFSSVYPVMRENFACVYKKSEVRAMYKALEFVAYNKQFRRSDLIKDVDEFSFKKFCDCARKLLVLKNMVVVVLGNFGDADLSVAIPAEMPLGDGDREYSLAAYETDPYLLGDMHSGGYGRDELIYNALNFNFFGENVSNNTKYFLMQLFFERLAREDSMLVLDECDAGLMFRTNKFESGRDILWTPLTEKEFRNLADRAAARKIDLLLTEPEQFCVEAGAASLCGASIIGFISGAESCAYEIYQTVLAAADIKIAEAQTFITNGGI